MRSILGKLHDYRSQLSALQTIAIELYKHPKNDKIS